MHLSLGSTMTVFDEAEVRAGLDEAVKESNAGRARLYNKMLAVGAERFVSKPSGGQNSVKALEQECPNFHGVLEDLGNTLELSLHSKGSGLSGPILLAGEPGVGKTYFAKRLAQALGLSYQFVSMGTMSAGWVLSGSAPTWSGARHGKVAQVLIEDRFANPLFLLDELDKTGGDSRYDPFGALLQLMEPETAQHFVDEFLDVHLNASAFVWVATANHVEAVPDYILSRMSVYEVPSPTLEESRVIADNVYESLRATYTWAFEPALGDDAHESLAKVPPRVMRRVLQDAMAVCCLNKRTCLQRSDFKDASKPARSMGFVR